MGSVTDPESSLNLYKNWQGIKRETSGSTADWASELLLAQWELRHRRQWNEASNVEWKTGNIPDLCLNLKYLIPEIHLNLFVHQWLYSSLLGPGLFFSFVIFFIQTVGLLGRVISPSQGRYLGRAITQAVNRWLPTAAARDQTWA
jgi:hypothetical protein